MLDLLTLTLATSVPFQPAARLLHDRPNGPQKEAEGTSWPGRFGNALVVAQIALGLMLLSGAGLSWWVCPRRVMIRIPARTIADLSIGVRSVPESRQIEFYNRCRTPASVPAGSGRLATPLPLTGSSMTVDSTSPSGRRHRPCARGQTSPSSPGFFKPPHSIAGGPWIHRSDDSGHPPVLTSIAPFQTFFPGTTAVGKRITGAAGRAWPTHRVLSGMLDSRLWVRNLSPSITSRTVSGAVHP